MTKDEVLKLALEALDQSVDTYFEKRDAAITAIKEALAQPEQEPVAWAYVNSDDECEQIEYCTESPMPEFEPLYRAPPRRAWVGLTDEEIQECLQGLPTQTIDVYARRIEAKLKEKNNG